MASPFPPNFHPYDPIQINKLHIRDKLVELLGLDEIPIKVGYDSIREMKTEQIKTTHISYRNSLGESIPGILMMPRTNCTSNRAGIVCIPGTRGCAEDLASSSFYESREGRLFGWARELTSRGFATLSITPKGSLSRCPNPKEWATEQKLLQPYGRTQMGLLVEETLKAARILASTPDVDPNRIGLTGFSLGGNATWYAMACASWIAAGVPLCGGLGSLATAIQHGDTDRHSGYFYIPHMLRYFDHPELAAACIPPRPFMIVAPTEDEDMPREGVDNLALAVSKSYAAAGYSERFKVHQPKGNHRFLLEYFEWMANWFGLFLKK